MREVAEFRGPGIHHHIDDSDEYDMDMDSRTRNVGGGANGHIILLGDGTEVLTDQNNSDSFENDQDRANREGTPGPEERSEEPEEINTPSSTDTNHSEADPMKTKSLPTSSPPASQQSN